MYVKLSWKPVEDENLSSFYFWSPPLARKMGKTNVLYFPVYPSRSWHSILAP
jgi:hypothetical protein